MSNKKVVHRVYENGRQSWRNEKGQLHRNPQEGPALIHADGRKEYRLNGELVKGPEGHQVIYPDGMMFNYPNGSFKVKHNISWMKRWHK